MRPTIIVPALACLSALTLAACGGRATLPVEAGMGSQPELPPPSHTLIPTMKIAPAKGWPDGAKPVAARDLAVNAYAAGLDHPRWLYVLPNGDVLVAETNAPPKPDDNKGVKAWFKKQVMNAQGQPFLAPTGLRCCAMRTRTASPKHGRCSCRGCIRRSA